MAEDVDWEAVEGAEHVVGKVRPRDCEPLTRSTLNPVPRNVHGQMMVNRVHLREEINWEAVEGALDSIQLSLCCWVRWKGYPVCRRCVRDTYPESCITKYTRERLLYRQVFPCL